MMVLEKDSSGRKLYDTAWEILRDENKQKHMREAMSSLGAIDAAEKIYG